MRPLTKRVDTSIQQRNSLPDRRNFEKLEGSSLLVRWRKFAKRGRLLRLLFPEPEPPFHKASLRGIFRGQAA